jgi:hypothetical protein
VNIDKNKDAEKNAQSEIDAYTAAHPLPEGLAYATSEELALALGSTPGAAKAIHARLERLAGGKLELVRTGAPSISATSGTHD